MILAKSPATIPLIPVTLDCRQWRGCSLGHYWPPCPATLVRRRSVHAAGGQLRSTWHRLSARFSDSTWVLLVGATPSSIGDCTALGSAKKSWHYFFDQKPDLIILRAGIGGTLIDYAHGTLGNGLSVHKSQGHRSRRNWLRGQKPVVLWRRAGRFTVGRSPGHSRCACRCQWTLKRLTRRPTR